MAQSTLARPASDNPLALSPSSSIVFVSDEEELSGEAYAGATDVSDSCDSCSGGKTFARNAVCSSGGQFCFRADYLVLWTRGARVPPLVTTGPVQGQFPPTAPPGALTTQGTQILFGNDRLNEDASSGIRLKLGYWFDRCRKVAIEADYYDSGSQTEGFSRFSSGEPVLARPFFDVYNQIQNSEVTAYPGLVMGSLDVRASDHFMSTGFWLRRKLWSAQRCGSAASCGDCGECDSGDCGGSCGTCGPVYRLDFVGGYRYYRLNDEVRIHQNATITRVGGAVQVGTNFDAVDSFRALNEFQGGDIGLVTRVCRGRWSLDFLTKMALGNNQSVVDINGRTVITVPGQTPVTHVGGIQALENNNIGHYTRSDFVVIPQFGVDLGYQLTCNTRVFMGYNFLYWHRVARAGEQIDFRLDPNNIPPASGTGLPYPSFNFDRSDFWAHWLNFGGEVCW